MMVRINIPPVASLTKWEFKWCEIAKRKAFDMYPKVWTLLLTLFEGGSNVLNGVIRWRGLTWVRVMKAHQSTFPNAQLSDEFFPMAQIIMVEHNAEIDVCFSLFC